MTQQNILLKFITIAIFVICYSYSTSTDLKNVTRNSKNHTKLLNLSSIRKASNETEDPFKFRYYQYHDLNQINNWFHQISKTYPNLVNLTILGYTHEQRPLILLKIANNVNDSISRPVIWIQGGAHAREWISVATTICLCQKILKILEKGNINSTLYRDVSNVQFVVIPIQNPDGYYHSWIEDRMWRKNRKPYRECLGVDLNRNWGLVSEPLTTSQANTTDNSHFINLNCSSTFPGPHAFSESETNLIAKYARRMQNLRVALELHNPGQLIIFPWGWTSEKPKDYDKLLYAAKLMSNRIYQTTGEIYNYGQISDLLYNAPGNSIDWFYSAMNVVYSFGIELRDLGEAGSMQQNHWQSVGPTVVPWQHSVNDPSVDTLPETSSLNDGTLLYDEYHHPYHRGAANREGGSDRLSHNHNPTAFRHNSSPRLTSTSTHPRPYQFKPPLPNPGDSSTASAAAATRYSSPPTLRPTTLPITRLGNQVRSNERPKQPPHYLLTPEHSFTHDSGDLLYPDDDSATVDTRNVIGGPQPMLRNPSSSTNSYYNHQSSISPPPPYYTSAPRTILRNSDDKAFPSPTEDDGNMVLSPTYVPRDLSGFPPTPLSDPYYSVDDEGGDGGNFGGCRRRNSFGIADLDYLSPQNHHPPHHHLEEPDDKYRKKETHSFQRKSLSTNTRRFHTKTYNNNNDPRLEEYGLFPLCFAVGNILKHFMGRMARLFLNLFCSRHAFSVSLSGLCFGITMGMFIGIYLESCGTDIFTTPPLMFNKNNVDDNFNLPPRKGDMFYARARPQSSFSSHLSNGGEFKYHSSHEDTGYEPRVINASSQTKGAIGGRPPRPAGSVPIVRPYHLASELGIVSKTAIVIVARENEPYPNDEAAPGGGGVDASEDSRIAQIVVQISGIEHNLRRQFGTIGSPLAFAGKRMISLSAPAGGPDVLDVIDTYLTIEDGTLLFHNVDDDGSEDEGAAADRRPPDPTFSFSEFLSLSKVHTEVLGNVAGEFSSYNPPLIGKIICFVRADAKDIRAVFTRHFPHLLPLVILPPTLPFENIGVNSNSDDLSSKDDDTDEKHDEVRAQNDLAALGNVAAAADYPDPDDIIDRDGGEEEEGGGGEVELGKENGPGAQERNLLADDRRTSKAGAANVKLGKRNANADSNLTANINTTTTTTTPFKTVKKLLFPIINGTNAKEAIREKRDVLETLENGFEPPSQRRSNSRTLNRVDRAILKFVRFVPIDAVTPSDYVSQLVTYLSDNYGQDFDTLYLTQATGAYLRLTSFLDFIGHVRKGQDTYVGTPVTQFNSDTSLLHERGNETDNEAAADNEDFLTTEDYCTLEAGILIGQTELINVRNNLNTCLDDIKALDGDAAALAAHTRGVSSRFQHILGSCMSQILQRKCQTTMNGKRYVTSRWNSRGDGESIGDDLYKMSVQNPLFNESILIYGLLGDDVGVASKLLTERDLKNTDFDFNAKQIREAYGLLDIHFNEVDIRTIESNIEETKAELDDIANYLSDANQNEFFSYGIPPRSMPTNHFDVIPWVYFNETHSLLPNEVETIRKHSSSERLEYGEVISFGKTQCLINNPSLTFVRFINGYKQNDPARGIEYILDFEYLLTPVSDQPPSMGKIASDENIQILPKRYHVMRPLGESIVSYESTDIDSPLPLPTTTVLSDPPSGKGNHPPPFPQRPPAAAVGVRVKREEGAGAADDLHGPVIVNADGHQEEEEEDGGYAVRGEDDDGVINPAHPPLDEPPPPNSLPPAVLIKYVLLPVWARDCPGPALQALTAFISDVETSSSSSRSSSFSINSLENTRLLLIFVTLDASSSSFNTTPVIDPFNDSGVGGVNRTTYDRLVKAFTRIQAERLDMIKREVVALKKSGAVPNIGWFTLPLPATFIGFRGVGDWNNEGGGFNETLLFDIETNPFPLNVSAGSPGQLIDGADDNILPLMSDPSALQAAIIRNQNIIINGFQYNGSLPIRILDTFAEKLKTKYGDERFFQYDKQPSPSTRPVNLVHLMPLNSRILAGPFFAFSRVNAIRGRRVAFPIPFQRYDPTIAKPTYEGYPHGYTYGITELKTSVGHYDTKNWGSAIFYLSDYLNARESLYRESEKLKSPFYQLKSHTTDTISPLDLRGLVGKWDQSLSTKLEDQSGISWDLPKLFITYSNLIERSLLPTKKYNMASQLSSEIDDYDEFPSIVDWNIPKNTLKVPLRKFEIFRYVEPNLILEHDPWEIVNCLPSISPNDDAADHSTFVYGYLSAMTNETCWSRNYDNVGTNVQMSFKIFETRMGINMTKYERIMETDRKSKHASHQAVVNYAAKKHRVR